jgi:hypothetical protein
MRCKVNFRVVQNELQFDQSKFQKSNFLGLLKVNFYGVQTELHRGV